MEKVTLNPTVELEHKLINFYKKVNKKELSIAMKLDKAKDGEACNKTHHALYLHIGLNFITILGLFYLLY